MNASRLNSGLACRGGGAFCKMAQFSFRNKEFRRATIQANNKLWKYPHDGLVNVFQSEKMDAYLPGELALVD
jgi:hypothetical protein